MQHRPKHIRNIFKTWRRSEDGTTALEFSLMAWPFFLLTFGIIELSMMFAAGSLLEGSLNDAARIIKTGQLQQSGSGGGEEMFEQALCQSIPALLDCNEVMYEVVALDSGGFAAAGGLDAQYNDDGDFEPRDFNAGEVNDVVLVRAVYDYHLFTPLIAQFMTAFTGRYRMVSTLVFQTEPYEFGVD